MAEIALPRDFDTRLAALDRAINRLQSNPEATPDEVVSLAKQFEQEMAKLQEQAKGLKQLKELAQQMGQRVRARNINPVGHTRLPRYVRGKLGTIEHEGEVVELQDMDANGAALGKRPQHVYRVCFTSRELWGEQANVRDAVYVDMWEDYLESA